MDTISGVTTVPTDHRPSLLSFAPAVCEEASKAIEKKEKGHNPLPPYPWACDLELHSKYLLKKDELAAEHKSYLLDHPELRALLSDFTQAVLLRKPTQLIPFAQQHFESFLKFSSVSSEPSSELSYTSSTTESSTNYYGEWSGEWAGEGQDNNFRMYNIRPTRSLDGLEKVSSEEELLDQVFNTEAEEEEQVIVSGGEYVVKATSE